MEHRQPHAHIIQHVAFETMGWMLEWLVVNNYQITYTRVYDSAHPFKDAPNPDTLDLLIVLGGVMDTNQEDEYPWLVEEKRFLKSCLGRTTIFGICLGSQLLAESLGGEVTTLPKPEIGWKLISTVELRSDSDEIHNLPKEIRSALVSDLKFPEWHMRTFSIPSNCVRFASSEQCPNQGFVGRVSSQEGNSSRYVAGIQFHPEWDSTIVKALVAGDSEEEEDGTESDGPQELLRGFIEGEEQKTAKGWLFRFLDALCGTKSL